MTATTFAPLAIIDLEEIGGYIAKDNPVRAASFVRELRKKAESISHAARAYPERKEIAQGLRVAIHGRYLILFRTSGGHVEIARIVHSARDLSRIFES
ncbi:MAG TPA: type II toxin-antitoxin system RelE/ParE family toxin [Rhizomicrobium sp.]